MTEDLQISIILHLNNFLHVNGAGLLATLTAQLSARTVMTVKDSWKNTPAASVID